MSARWGLLHSADRASRYAFLFSAGAQWNTGGKDQPDSATQNQ